MKIFRADATQHRSSGEVFCVMPSETQELPPDLPTWQIQVRMTQAFLFKSPPWGIWVARSVKHLILD